MGPQQANDVNDDICWVDDILVLQGLEIAKFLVSKALFVKNVCYAKWWVIFSTLLYTLISCVHVIYC